MRQRGGKKQTYENITKPFEINTKMAQTADGQARGAIKTIRELYKPLEHHTKTSLKADRPTWGTIQTIRTSYNAIGKPCDTDTDSRWANEG